jgi:lysozyme
MIQSDKCYGIIKHFESCVLKAYQDITGVWTIGWGSISYENGAPIKQGDIIPQFRADDLLKFEADSKARSVQNLTSKIRIQQCQFDALVSFAYNLGVGALSGSTLLKKVIINPSDPFINNCFLMWNKAKVKTKDPKTGLITSVLRPVDGLTSRRKSESWLYFHNELKYFK